MAGHPFDKAAIHIAKGEIGGWAAANANMKMCLTTSAPAQSTAEVYGDLANEVAGGSGYTQGGTAMTLIDPTITGADPNSYAKLRSNDVTWAAATFTANYGVIYYDGATKYLVGYIDFGGAKTGQGGNFTVQCPTAGWFELQTP